MVVNGICLAGMEEGLVDKSLAADLKPKLTPSSLKEAAALCGVNDEDLRDLARVTVPRSRAPSTQPSAC